MEWYILLIVISLILASSVILSIVLKKKGKSKKAVKLALLPAKICSVILILFAIWLVLLMMAFSNCDVDMKYKSIHGVIPNTNIEISANTYNDFPEPELKVYYLNSEGEWVLHHYEMESDFLINTKSFTYEFVNNERGTFSIRSYYKKSHILRSEKQIPMPPQ